MGTQFSLHKISYDPEGYKNWDEETTKEKKDIFRGLIKKLIDDKDSLKTMEELERSYDKWAASWDCKENESENKGYLVGDEIGVGALWEDKSQKDFKSYL